MLADCVYDANTFKMPHTCLKALITQQHGQGHENTLEYMCIARFLYANGLRAEYMAWLISYSDSYVVSLASKH